MSVWPPDQRGRLDLSLSLILDMLGVPNVNGLVRAMGQLAIGQGVQPAKLDFYQALWVQFHPSHGMPPPSLTQCVKYIEAEVHVNLKQMFDSLLVHPTMDRVIMLPTRKALKKQIRKRANRMPLEQAKELMLQPLMTSRGPGP